MATNANGSFLDDRLKGWKEIGDFLHTCDRTAQRWEHHLHLPVHRVPTSKSGIVFASRDELQAWLQTAEGKGAVEDQADPLSEVPESGACRQARLSSLRRMLGCVAIIAAVAVVLGFALAQSGLAGAGAKAFAGKPNGQAASTIVAPPGQTAILRLTLANGETARIGSLEGTVTSIAIAGRTLALSARPTGDALLIHLYRATGERAAERQTLAEVAVMSLRLGEKQSIQGGYGLQAIEWLKTLPPPPNGASKHN